VAFLELLCPHSKQLGALVIQSCWYRNPNVKLATISAVLKKGTQGRPQGGEGLSKSTGRIYTLRSSGRFWEDSWLL